MQRIYIDQHGVFRSCAAEVLLLPQPQNGVAKCIVCSPAAGYERPFTDEFELRDVLKKHKQAAGVFLSDQDVDALVDWAMESSFPTHFKEKKSGKTEGWLDAYGV